VSKHQKTEVLKTDKIEVVFLPYKAAMWDSLESVWSAAVEDPQCDAYVIPIPYFDRSPDGALGQMHYEGSEYPDYVPVVDWRSYDIENQRPDIIYVHNPYDEYNPATSVHPDFYSKRLKEFTDMLVYIPYFVSVGDDVDKDFCVLPGTLYADRVVVQSEAVRQAYIREFKEAEKIFDCVGQFGNAEEKFLTLGSPKFDKARTIRPEDCQIPDEWRRMIDKPDGTRKKVILYNTTFGSILKGDEKYLHKIRCVLEYFRGRYDVVLLWRPHPLSAAAYKSMRPQFLQEYENIVSEYKQQRFGIYDDTPDVHRAIAMADAYYGDWSSLVALFEQTGKPVMIQDINIISGKR